MRKKIGDSNNTDIWWDPWLAEVPLCRWPTFIDCGELMKYGRVKKLTVGDAWNLEAIKRCFGEDLIEKIEVIQVYKEGGKDSWIWTANESANISVKSAYWHLKEKETLKDETSVD
ncbi:hypothetical protein Cni_G25122 [Canna indica]|uniref:Uncharacterized protein n=1 Tax=Canna indica TaxID=4628 RepID=A0AAQ3QQ80_9LILI|nr:hypothetical protein Cni_G25122 [Canna indica]